MDQPESIVPIQAPQVHKMWNVLSILFLVLFILSALFNVFLFMSWSSASEEVDGEVLVEDGVDKENNDVVMEEEEEDIIATKVFENAKYSFEYPNGWHIFAENIFDDSNRINASLQTFLNPDPIVMTSPSDGPSINSVIRLYVMDEGEAYLAPYESDLWEEYRSEEIQINGQDATVLYLTASDDMAYTPKYQEVIFVHGVELVYSSNEENQEDSSVWDLLKGTLVIK